MKHIKAILLIGITIGLIVFVMIIGLKRIEPNALEETTEITIPSKLEPESVVPLEFGGEKKSDCIFSSDEQPDKWLCSIAQKFVLSGIEKGFVKGYARGYTKYTLENNEEVQISHPMDLIVFYVLKYETKEDALKARDQLLTDFNLKEKIFKNIKIWSNEETGNMIYSNEFIIWIPERSKVAKDLTSRITELYLSN